MVLGSEAWGPIHKIEGLVAGDCLSIAAGSQRVEEFSLSEYFDHIS